MVHYDIYFYCEECRQTHPMGVKIRIRGGPSDKMSLSAFYAGKQPSPEIANFIDSQVLCPKTGKMHTQKDFDQIFLVPVK